MYVLKNLQFIDISRKKLFQKIYAKQMVEFLSMFVWKNQHFFNFRETINNHRKKSN